MWMVIQITQTELLWKELYVGVAGYYKKMKLKFIVKL